MRTKISMSIHALTLAIAVAAFSFGVSANSEKRAAENEANQLREQIAQMQVPVLDSGKQMPENLKQAAFNGTNTVAALKAELTALRAELAEAEENQPPRREGWEERIARMKEEDPEGYAEMIKRREERRNAMRYDLAKRTANFMELDTAFMTDAERENHELLLEKMAMVWEFTEQFRDPEQSPDRETMRELFTAMNEARPLMNMERDTMFRQLANELGFEGEVAQAFSGYVEKIISTTTLRPPRGMGSDRPSGRSAPE